MKMKIENTKGEVIFEYTASSIKELLCIALKEKISLQDAYLRSANLQDADLSAAKNIEKASDWIIKHGIKTKKGFIFYKTFGGQYAPSTSWKIKNNQIIEENCNFSRTIGCGCGINIGTKDWVNKNYPKGDVYEILIEFEWLAGVCVPYNTDGKIRCEKARILKKVKR